MEDARTSTRLEAFKEAAELLERRARLFDGNLAIYNGPILAKELRKNARDILSLGSK